MVMTLQGEKGIKEEGGGGTWSGQLCLGRRPREGLGRPHAAKYKVMKGMDQVVHKTPG